MGSTAFIIIFAVVGTLIYFAVRFGILRLVYKAGNVIDSKIVDYKNANHPAEPVRLADLYPDFVASLKATTPSSRPAQAIPMNAPAISSVATNTIPVQKTSVSSRFVQPKAFRPDRCCLCGTSLEKGYAVLFSNYQGEARIDENCCNGIAQMMRSQDKQQVYEAYNYFAGLYQQMQPAVAEHIANYLTAAENYLQSNT